MGKAKHPHDSSRPASAGVKLGVEIYREEGDIDYLRKHLSPRQARFCEEYIVDFDATAAYIRAGYSPNAAMQGAANLRKNEGVLAYIEYLSLSKQAKIVSVNPDYVLQKVTEIISKADTKDGDKLRGLELLARHLGMFIDRTEITGKDGEAIRVEQQQIEQDKASVVNLLKSMRDKNIEKKDVQII